MSDKETDTHFAAPTAAPLSFVAKLKPHAWHIVSAVALLVGVIGLFTAVWALGEAEEACDGHSDCQDEIERLTGDVEELKDDIDTELRKLMRRVDELEIRRR